MNNQQEQMGEFMKHYVTIENYKDVQQQLAELNNTKKETVESELDQKPLTNEQINNNG